HVALARRRVRDRHVPVRARRIDRAENRADDQARAGSDGEIAADVVAAVQQRDAAADRKTGQAAVQRIARDHRDRAALRARLDQSARATVVTFAAMGPVDVELVGGGARGTLVALQLLQTARGPFRIALIERARTIGRGVAYASAEPCHLLNVPAAGMSAFPDRPDDFVRWSGARPDQFVPRSVYGDYLSATLAEARGQAGTGVCLVVLGGEAVGLSTADRGIRIVFSDGVELPARAAVLALGNLPSVDLVASGERTYRETPWDAGALDGLEPEAPVLFLGTGLTMVDAALALESRGHRGPMHALSRRGLLPQEHGEDAPAPQLRIGASGVRGLRRAIRAAARAATDWRAIVDALRPVTQRIWTRLS